MTLSIRLGLVSFFFISTFFSFSVEPVRAKHLQYKTNAGPVKGKLNVHLVPHSHDDVGWLKTIDQYYVGTNNSIQVACVQYILDTVIEKLLENPDRKYIQVEQAFFQRWWREQSEETKWGVRKLVKRGQLEFINGGWCMHDEASTHYIDMIDQTTLGHRYIKEQFNKVPTVTWQADPFGHSAVQAYLLSAEAGFDAVFFARADWQDILKRRKTRSMEFVWRASDSLGETADVFGGVTHFHYTAPDGFHYAETNPSPPFQDDPDLYDVNVKERVDAFIKLAEEQASQFRTNHIMWTMGDDFAYGNAHSWFKNLDKLIHYVNLDGRVNTFYSTPSIYVEQKHAAEEEWPLKKHDFFPYADSPHNFWTGYFTSRPTFKGYVRSLSALLQTVRQLETMVGRQPHGGPTSDLLEEAMAVSQHHDAVSGTEKQHVANDYSTRLYKGQLEAARVFTSALATLIGQQAASSVAGATEEDEVNGDTQRTEDSSMGSVSPVENLSVSPSALPTVFEHCGLFNISYCPVSQEALASGKTLVVVLYNPLAWSRKEFVSIPVGASSTVGVTDSKGDVVESQIVPVLRISAAARSFYVEAEAGAKLDGSNGNDEPQELIFEAEVPPLGFSTYFVSPLVGGSDGAAFVSKAEKVQASVANNVAVSIGGSKSAGIEMRFSAAAGRISQIVNHNTGVSCRLKQSMLWYNASNGIEAGPQASGAYIFRPNSSDPFPLPPDEAEVVQMSIVRGPLVEDVQQTFSPWASQVVRIFRGRAHAEVQFKVGPIPIDDDFGKEVITRMSTDLASAKTFYTDSNGRDYLKRVVDYREDWKINVTDPVAGNYYPVNSGIYIGEETGEGREFSVLVDRSVGAASLEDGEIEVMLHRRLLHDDNKGVAESLNETVCVGDKCEGRSVLGTYYVSVDSKSRAARWRREQTQRILFPLQMAFTTTESSPATIAAALWSETHATTYSAVAAESPGGAGASLEEPGLFRELPPNVALITMQELAADKSILIRLAHLYEACEDAELSQLASVDLADFFPKGKVKHVVETTLTANQEKRKLRRRTWKLESQQQTIGNKASSLPEACQAKLHKDLSLFEGVPVRGKILAAGSTVVEIGPMEIRTFVVYLHGKAGAGSTRRVPWHGFTGLS
eukprot:TRINITY_DN556_c0_g1_i1.p1 TRINITY_DN556_c0_g1~~TRINITY_DN556_c0_g1_i1.p1  ORF type:complete len:1134 (+),score=191.83 TRINITY_DN556_c0_g1_i1:196-3597(+)